MADKWDGIIVSFEGPAQALLWNRFLGKVRFYSDDAVYPKLAGGRMSNFYHLGNWVRFRPEPTRDDSIPYEAKEVEGWVAGTKATIPPRVCYNIFKFNDFEVKEVLGFVANSHEQETTVWTEELGIVTHQGGEGAPPIHTWIHLKAEFRDVRMSSDYYSQWELTEWEPANVSIDPAEWTPKRLTVDYVRDGTFRLGESLIEIPRHSYYSFFERPGQFYFLLEVDMKKDPRLNILVVESPVDMPGTDGSTLTILYAAPPRHFAASFDDAAKKRPIKRSVSLSDLAPPPKPQNLLSKVIDQNRRQKPRELQDGYRYLSRTPATTQSVFSREAQAARPNPRAFPSTRGRGVAGVSRPIRPAVTVAPRAPTALPPATISSSSNAPVPRQPPPPRSTEKPLELMPVAFMSAEERQQRRRGAEPPAPPGLAETRLPSQTAGPSSIGFGEFGRGLTNGHTGVGSDTSPFLQRPGFSQPAESSVSQNQDPFSCPPSVDDVCVSAPSPAESPLVDLGELAEVKVMAALLSDEDCWVYIQNNFPDILSRIRELHKEVQAS